MASKTPGNAKEKALKAAGTLHPHPARIQDEIFRHHAFFDPKDRVQVKYEMLRRHRVESRPITEVASLFGTSRQAFYLTQAAFEKEGVVGLLPRARGPQRAHKCSDAILDFVEQWRNAPPQESSETLPQVLLRRFGVNLHPRSIDRALARRKKKLEKARGKPQ